MTPDDAAQTRAALAALDAALNAAAAPISTCISRTSPGASRSCRRICVPSKDSQPDFGDDHGDPHHRRAARRARCHAASAAAAARHPPRLHRLDSRSVDAFAAEGHVLLAFLEDPVRYKETLDLAVIAPEIARAFAGRLRAGASSCPTCRARLPRATDGALASTRGAEGRRIRGRNRRPAQLGRVPDRDTATAGGGAAARALGGHRGEVGCRRQFRLWTLTLTGHD